MLKFNCSVRGSRVGYVNSEEREVNGNTAGC